MSEQTFEQAMNRIQTIVSSLEKGDVKLEEATTLFEEGLELLDYCETQLQRFQDKVETLKQKSKEPNHGDE